MAKPLPDYVLQALIDAGKVTGDGLGRSAQLRTCRQCLNYVLRGLDHHRCALTVVADPVALSPLAEALALLAGRATYALYGKELQRRDAFHIRGGHRSIVVADHDCGNALPPTPDILSQWIPAKRMGIGNQCPY